MASLFFLAHGTLNLDFYDLSIAGNWTYRQGQLAEFDVFEIKTQHMSSDLLSHIQKQEPKTCWFYFSQEDSTEKLSFQAFANLPQWAIWWLEALRLSALPNSIPETVFVLLLPTSGGFILRNDIFERRLNSSVRVRKTWSQLDSRKRVVERNRSARGFPSDLEALLLQSICGVLSSTRSDGELGDILDVLLDRLSLPLFMKTQLERKRIAIVEGGFSVEFQRDLFNAVCGLGVDLVVLDRQGHWLQEAEFSRLTEGFLPVDMRINDDLPKRLVAAIRAYGYPIHGITTLSDNYLSTTAIAAEMLGLPTSPPDSFRTCVDKISTRELIPLPRVQHLDVPERRDESSEVPIYPSYPVILKPSQGGGSLGIFLARNAAEQSDATERIRRLGKDVIIEHYIDGPEVDVNIVLQDGRVSFWEVSDDLPSTAEGFPSQFSAKSWKETGNVFPSCLAQVEINRLKEFTVACLLNLGFRWGVFHCEARVQNSSGKYRLSGDGWPRLTVEEKSDEIKAEVAMIEINARPPGYFTSTGSACAYGVDYCALQLMAAVRDNDRFQALSVPYRRSPSECWECAFVPVEKGGLFRKSVMFEELMVTAPELMKNVYRWTTFFKDGDEIQDPNVTGKALWAAWFVVFSTQGREHLDNTVAALRVSLKFSVV